MIVGPLYYKYTVMTKDCFAFRVCFDFHCKYMVEVRIGTFKVCFAALSAAQVVPILQWVKFCLQEYTTRHLKVFKTLNLTYLFGLRLFRLNATRILRT